MRTYTLIAIAAGLLLAAGAAMAAATDVKPTNKWSGSVDDEALLKEAPKQGFIADEKTFTKVWKAWKVGDKVPTIDFKKELAVFETTSGSRLNVNARLTEDGDLKVLGLATRDLVPGFRYQILIVPREGVKTVNGKPLPKDE
jgi:hypothetical protein